MIRDPDPQPTGSAADFLPAGRATLEALRRAAANCHGCDLFKHATQTVFGEGPVSARVMLVGEQPGDQEDQQGRPFVGPAGLLLERALEEAEIDREKVYVTNAVKHFKFTQRGKRRMHAKPNARQIAACRPWLDAEVNLVRPDVLVAMGATAAQSLFGSNFRVSRQRGQLFSTELAGNCYATLHPSALIRIRDANQRTASFKEFVSDLRIASD
ncbi:MAG: UdgX family uracil-DNA binding protein, partial [Phycisphaeraceae bacterium]